MLRRLPGPALATEMDPPGFDERFGDGEPYTGAAMLAVAGGVCPVEPFEHSGDVLGGDPSPVSATMILIWSPSRRQ